MKTHLICTLIAGLTALGTLGAAEKTKAAPETDGAPKKTKAAPAETDGAPKKTKAAPAVAGDAPKKTKVAPEVTGKQKGSDVNSYPFWTGGKKAGAVTQFAPGLNAALQLSESQKEQIAAARDEVMNDEAVKAARGISKSDPNVTAEQREKGRAALDAANARLRERVASILTPEQKSLIEKINAAYAAANEETGIIYSEKFASPSAKLDPEARRRLQAEKSQDFEEGFLHKLDAILSPAQKEAMTRAAEEEAKRGAAAGGAKKPVKQ